jgi:hypothetical protein
MDSGFTKNEEGLILSPRVELVLLVLLIKLPDLRARDRFRPTSSFEFLKRIGSRVARFFLVQYTKAGKNIPNDYKIPKYLQNFPNDCKIFQLTLIYINTSHSKILPKIQIGIFGLKRNHLATLIGSSNRRKDNDPVRETEIITIKRIC